MNSLLNDIVSLAKKAGNQVLKIYQSDFTVGYKNDKSPITVADLASHECICQGLRHITPDLPIISEESIIKEACVIMPNVVVNAKSSVGVGVILNTACVVEHDCAIGSFSHIAPRSVMCGGVSVGEMTHIGAGSVIIEGKKIGDSCLVGAGSVVINDIESFKKVVGNPAKKELK